MKRPLVPHPKTLPRTPLAVEAEVSRARADALEVRFRTLGDIAALRIPMLRARTRADGLWEHTCFEVFLCEAPGEAYYEFNLSPSTHWAAYGFTGAGRLGRTSPEGARPPRIETRVDGEAYEFAATLDLERLANLRADAKWVLGLSAVIEERDGRKSYWALRHPLDAPDFHHPDGFICELAPPS